MRSMQCRERELDHPHSKPVSSSSCCACDQSRSQALNAGSEHMQCSHMLRCAHALNRHAHYIRAESPAPHKCAPSKGCHRLYIWEVRQPLKQPSGLTHLSYRPPACLRCAPCGVGPRFQSRTLTLHPKSASTGHETLHECVCPCCLLTVSRINRRRENACHNGVTSSCPHHR